MPEALELLGRARPLGGGTALTPRRTVLPGVLDLQGLDLAGIEPGDGRLLLGGTLRLQTLTEGIAGLPPALSQACRQEAGWNLRNQATLAGSVVTGDGRSPLLAALLALDGQLRLEPGGEQVSLEQFLAERPGSSNTKLIAGLDLPQAAQLGFEGVARSPADLPLVCAAVSRSGSAPDREWRVVLGGYGDRPIRVQAAERALAGMQTDLQASLDSAAVAAAAAYSAAADAWAGAEYRSAVAGVLVRRLAQGLA
jgi:CO/xanthine dehydrogenase FAD-binding subunit